MAEVILIVGDTGTGKSSSIRTLPPDETVVLNVLDKSLPFKGSRAHYNREKGNVKLMPSAKGMVESLQKLPKAKPKIKYVILDDLGFVMQIDYFNKSAVTGYGKFAGFAKDMKAILDTANAMPDYIKVYCMFHEEAKGLDIDNVKKVKLIGKMLEDKYNPIATVTICLFTEVEFGADGKASYNFICNRSIDKFGRVIPAKSPDGMFEEVKIPNDLALVSKKIDEYYG